MSTGEKWTYQRTAIDDLFTDYSPEHFRFAVQQCRNVIAQVVAEDNSSDQQIARVKILRYLDLQLGRASRWIEDDADLMAGVLRSIIELKFWAIFISENAENARRFLKEAEVDALELFEKMKKLAPPDTYELIDAPTIQNKRVSVKTSDDREALLWKMCSKLVHPSSWVLNNTENTIRSPEQRRVLSLYVVYYGWGVLAIFHDIEWTD